MVTAKRNSPSPDMASQDEDMLCARPFKRALVTPPAAAGADSLGKLPYSLVQPCPGSAPWSAMPSFSDATRQAAPASSGSMGGWSFRSQPYPQAHFPTVPPPVVAEAPMETDSMSIRAPAAPTEMGQSRRQTMAWAGLVFNRTPSPAQAPTQRPSSAPPSMGASPTECSCSLLLQGPKGGQGGGALVGRCRHCDRGLCTSCVKKCARCEDAFCTLCSTVNYDNVFERLLCIECNQAVSREQGEEGMDVC